MSPIDWVETRRLAIVAGYKRGLQPEDAEDIAQIVCLSLLRARYEDAPPQLIFVAVQRAHINIWRKRRRERDFADYEETPDVTMAIPPLEELMDVGTAIAKLPPGQRNAVRVELTRRRSLTNGEKQQLFKARKALATA